MKRGWSSDASKRTRGSVPSHLGLLGVIAVVTGLIAAGVDRAGAGAEWVAGVVLIGLAVVGSVLWWTNSEKKAWDELGRSVLVGVLLAAAVGVVQFEIDARQRDRSHRLEARQRDREHRFTLSQQGDLTGIDLANDHLASAYLAHKNLSYANLRGAHLENASLFESTLVGADLHGAHLQGAQMRGAYLNDATLDGADLTSADLRGAHFRGARLQNATLPGARLGGAELNDACLASAHLRGANLTSASLKRAVLTGADLRDVIFNDDLRNANLYRAGFAGALNDWPRGWPPDFRPSRLRPPMVLPQPHADQAGLSGAVSRIARVRDADTVELAGRRGVHVPVRLLGINAPSLTDRIGKEGKVLLERLTSHRRVRYMFDPSTKPKVTKGKKVKWWQDKFGRGLVYLWLDHGPLLNELLVQQGYADGRPGQIRFAARIRRAADQARRVGEGIWGTCPSPS